VSAAAEGGAFYESGRTLVAALDSGSDLLEEIERLVRENGIVFCAVSGIGSLAESRVTYYDQAAQEDREIVFERPLMLVTLSGTVLRSDGDVHSHCHLVLGDAAGLAFGGDLSPGCIVYSCELRLLELVGPRIARAPNAATGLSQFVFGKGDGG
jgi:predicted DNA-binding protein with PD1-like motif